MTEIFLIRHTQAEGNLYRMMQGHWDGNVTRRGWQQIEALAERFADVHIDAVYSSDLYRTRMTATAVTRHRGLELHCDRRFREIDLGPWEAHFFGNLAREFPREIDDFLFHPDRWQVAGAETCAQVRERAYAALVETAARHDGESIAIVSHGVTIRCLMAAVLGLTPERLEEVPIHGNTAVSRLIYEDGRFTVDYANDMSHLEKMGIPPWHRNKNLYHLAIDPVANRAFYTLCYEQAWHAGHGSLEGFRADNYIAGAMSHYVADRESILCFYDEDKAVGILDMDTKRGADEGYGWISLIDLIPEYRGKGYGAQLLGRAIKKYSDMGRRAIRLTVAEGNKEARDFYAKHDFEEIGTEHNALGKLLLMEKKLGVRKDV